MTSSSKSKRPKVRRYPVRCECGVRLLYAEDFGMVFSCCDRCTPVVTIKIGRSIPNSLDKPLGRA